MTEVKDRRRLSGYHPHAPWRYSATPRFMSKTTVRNYVLKRMDGNHGYTPLRQFGEVRRVGGYCTNIPIRVEDLGPQYPIWFVNEVSFTGTEYVKTTINSSEVDAAVTSVENEVANEALTCYDLLTEIAEARELPSFVRSSSNTLIDVIRTLKRSFSLKDLKRAAHITPRDLLKHPYRVFRDLGDLWMGYRYGLMPLIYSARDLLKMMDRGVNMTSRKSKYIVPYRTSTNMPSASTDYKWSEMEGTVVVRGTIFQHFNWDTAAKYAGVGINPFVTAWELIPYSFVFDWFVNVGDYITRSTTLPLNDGYSGCMSKRTTTTKKIWVHYKADNKSINVPYIIPNNWVGSYPLNPPSIPISRPEESQLLQTITVDEYSRWCLYSLNAAKLQVNPSLNWKRLLDSAVMSHNLLRNALSFLK